MENLKIIKDLFKDTPDLIIRPIKKRFNTVYIIFLETVSSGDRVNSYILNPLTLPSKNKLSIEKALSGPNLKVIDINDVEKYLCSGFTIILDKQTIYAVETKAELDRGIDEAKVEPAIYGPKDSLVENINKNIGLIKRRIKSSHLKIKDHTLGRYSKTSTSVLYIDNIAKVELVLEITKKLDSIDTDAITSAGELKQYLFNENINVFPPMKLTERPDTIISALLEGKIIILVDNSPFAIILPAVLADFINPTVDDYTSALNTNYLKVLRMICFILTIITPAFYIATTNYNQETIPGLLLMNIATQRFGVPFPSIVEAIIMLFVCELLRESDVRFASNYGSAVSILGALVLGESAVASGIVSPIMIIVIAITFVSSLMFNEVEINGAVRTWRYIYLLFASLLGLYGLTLAFIMMLINLCSYKVYNLSYMFPISPLDFSYLKETLLKVKRKKQDKRSKYLTDNVRKQA
ncbi:MAG: spore germination protein [Bacilli bacterium]|nr:spore germination protein [Bacilli bacterium]MDD4795824.1 spore germination protein [Bacilli bacterium]